MRQATDKLLDAGCAAGGLLVARLASIYLFDEGINITSMGRWTDKDNFLLLLQQSLISND